MYTIIIILIGHYIADFIFQTEDLALGKSSSKSLLFIHSLMYSVLMTFTIMGVIIVEVGILSLHFYELFLLLFFVITLILHFAVDFVTSKITKKLFEKQILYTEFPNFGAFSIIGLDQLIHYMLLFLTYYLLLTI